MQVSILEQLPPHDPLSAHVQVLVVNNQQPPEAHTVLAQAQQRFGSHRSVRFASSPNCNPVQSRLQPCAIQAAILCNPGCNPVQSRLRLYVLQVRFVAKRPPTPPLKCPGRQGGSGAVTASVQRHDPSGPCSKCTMIQVYHAPSGPPWWRRHELGTKRSGPNMTPRCGPEARQNLRLSQLSTLRCRGRAATWSRRSTRSSTCSRRRNT